MSLSTNEAPIAAAPKQQGVVDDEVASNASRDSWPDVAALAPAAVSAAAHSGDVYVRRENRRLGWTSCLGVVSGGTLRLSRALVAGGPRSLVREVALEGLRAARRRGRPSLVEAVHAGGPLRSDRSCRRLRGDDAGTRGRATTPRHADGSENLFAPLSQVEKHQKLGTITTHAYAQAAPGGRPAYRLVLRATPPLDLGFAGAGARRGGTQSPRCLQGAVSLRRRSRACS